MVIPSFVQLEQGFDYVWWWIGLNDNGHDGQWTWFHSGQEAIYHHWDIDEPSLGISHITVENKPAKNQSIFPQVSSTIVYRWNLVWRTMEYGLQCLVLTQTLVYFQYVNRYI